jgi:Tfp pilus assembly protein PilO
MSKIVPIIFLVTSGLLFFFVIDPMYNGKGSDDLGIKGILQEKAAYDDVLSRARDLQSKRDELRARYNSISAADKTRLEQLLPDTLDNVKLVLDIDRIASRQGLRIKNIAVNSSAGVEKNSIIPDEKGYGTATITFSISAPYDVFLSFLGDLEDGLRLIDITTLGINPKDPKAFDYSVTFKTYWLKK